MSSIVLALSCVILLQDIPKENVKPHVWRVLKRYTAVEIYELYEVYKELYAEHKKCMKKKN